MVMTFFKIVQTIIVSLLVTIAALAMFILMCIFTPHIIYRYATMKRVETNVYNSPANSSIVKEILTQRGLIDGLYVSEMNSRHEADNKSHYGCMVLYFKTKQDVVAYELSVGDDFNRLVQHYKRQNK